MNSKSEERQLKDASKEAHKKTKTFVDKVTKNEREAFENLRVMVDEEDIFTKLFCKKGLKEYYEKHLKDGIDLDYKTVSSRLNVARMIHDFEREEILIPENAEYTPLRTLTSAFCNNDNKRNLQIMAWKIATQKYKNPDNQDIVDAIERVKSKSLDDNEVETSDDDYEELDNGDDDYAKSKNLTPESGAVREQNKLIKESTDYEELAAGFFDKLPKEFQSLFKNYSNDIFFEMLSAISDLANYDDCDHNIIKRRANKAIETLKDYVLCLQDYEEDQEAYNNITNNVYYLYYYKRHAKAKRTKKREKDKNVKI